MFCVEVWSLACVVVGLRFKPWLCDLLTEIIVLSRQDSNNCETICYLIDCCFSDLIWKIKLTQFSEQELAIDALKRHTKIKKNNVPLEESILKSWVIFNKTKMLFCTTFCTLINIWIKWILSALLERTFDQEPCLF